MVDNKGDVLVRLNLTNFPLLTPDGLQLDILELLRTLQGHQPHSFRVCFDHQKRRYEARLIAVRNSAAATKRTQRKLEKEARKKKRTVKAQTMEGAGYTLVLTTVKEEELSAWKVMQLYRARWQVELAFKRLKSLMKLGEVPTRNDKTSRAWLQAKLLLALLTEGLLEAARIFSPWGYELGTRQSLERAE